MQCLLKLHNFFKNLSKIKFIIVMILLNLLIAISLNPIVHFLNLFSKTPDAGPNIYSYSFTFQLILTCLMGPILETFIFQRSIIYVLKKIKINNIIIIFISSLFFGLAHHYSIGYMFITFIIGILYSYTYIIYEDKSQSPFWAVAIIHASYNSIIMLINNLF